jgi:hypothetical protein
MSVIYLLDAMGILSGPVTIPEIPGLGRVLPANAVELPELAAARPGHVWVYRDGQVVELLDARGTYYRTANGERVEHAELGELPDGLTAQERPGPYHAWQDGAWVLDAGAQLEAAQADERDWRDGVLASVAWMRDRHRDQVEIGGSTSLAAEQYLGLLQYMQDLRDWPQSAAFPAQAARPQPPEWLMQIEDA